VVIGQHDRTADRGVLSIGTYEEALEWRERRAPAVHADHPPSPALVRYFCAMVHDANASYWDDEFAEEAWGSGIAPPAMLMTWSLAPEWSPARQTPAPLLLAEVPLPGPSAISTECDVEFFRPVRMGEWLVAEERVRSVSTLHETRLGPGHFVTTETLYRAAEGDVVACYVHVLFRFVPQPLVADFSKKPQR